MTLNIISALAVFTLAFLSSIEAQEGVPCHVSFFQFTSRHSLDITRYTGDWYVHAIAGSDIGNFPPPSYKCSRRTLTLPDLDNILNIEATDSFVNKTDGIMRQTRGSIQVNNTRSPFTSLWSMVDDQGVSSQIIIMSADLEFQEWTIVYSCSILEPNAYRYETVSAMTRSREITEENRNFLKALMVGLGFRITDNHPVEQTDC